MQPHIELGGRPFKSTNNTVHFSMVARPASYAEEFLLQNDTNGIMTQRV